MDDNALFDPVLLDRCRMPLEDILNFKSAARMAIRKDEETGARIVAYVHPDGRVLIDGIRIPPPSLR